MRYKCQFPECDYETDIRSQIHIHHIVPRELGGCDSDYNLVQLCPNHHTKIYIPEAKQGCHTMRGPDSIILLRKFNNNRILQYIDSDNELKYKLI